MDTKRYRDLYFTVLYFALTRLQINILIYISEFDFISSGS